TQRIPALPRSSLLGGPPLRAPPTNLQLARGVRGGGRVRPVGERRVLPAGAGAHPALLLHPGPLDGPVGVDAGPLRGPAPRPGAEPAGQVVPLAPAAALDGAVGPEALPRRPPGPARHKHVPPQESPSSRRPARGTAARRERKRAQRCTRRDRESRGTGAVSGRRRPDARTTSRVSRTMPSGAVRARARSARTRAISPPIRSVGWCTVVSGGSALAASAVSS